MNTELAAPDQIDSNMPQLDVEPEVKPEETTPVVEAETAPAPVEKEGAFVETDNDKVQSRINKITAEKYAEKRRADELQKRLDEQAPAPQATQQTGEPKLEDFDFDEAAHTSALIDYKVNQKATEIQRQQQQGQAQVKAQQVQSNFNSKAAEFTEKAPDYEQVIANVPQLPPETLDALMQADNGPQMAYYLGKHLDVADEIATASPMVAAMRLGQISAQLTATTKTVNTSAAPAPIEPVGSAGTASRSMEDMSMEELYNME